MHISLIDTWKRLTLWQRAGVVGVLAAVFGGILLVAVMGSRPTYGVLFSNLEPGDAGAVTAKLRDQKIDYHLQQGGRTIEVPQEKVYDLRNSLAADGVPRGGTVGFELFDKPNFGATDFTQRLNYQRALQGELERTISKLDGVDGARVHLAIPEKRLFQQQQDPATASVVLHLRPGYRVPEPQVAGIVHLVSAAVEGLKTDDVSVHDAQGELLSGEHATGATLTGGQIEIQEQFERRMESQLTHLAEQVLGAGKAAVRVSADLNWDQQQTETETYRGAGENGTGIPIEETTSSESYDKGLGAPAAGGVAGAPSNMTTPPPAATTTPGAARPGQYLNTRATNRYAVNKVVEKKVTAPGKLRRLSVAVLLDGKISAAQQASLKNAFAAAAGLELAAGGRGDKIELLPMAFDRTAQAEEEKAAKLAAKQAAQTALYRNIAAASISLLVVLATLILGLRALKPARRRLDAVIADSAPVTYTAAGTTVPEAAPEKAEDLVLPPLEVARRLASERPEEVARQLAVWMKE